jgi:aconitate hydratase
MNLTYKLLAAHLESGELAPGNEIAVRICQTLTQDSTGTMAYLQLEAMGIKRVRTEKSVAYIDHNTLQTGYENADDHRYLHSVARKYGIYCSKPGNGICHQVHLERYGVPGKTLLGSDSHTPTCGALGMLAMGAGGLDVAVAMSGGAYWLTCPEVINIRLTGKLSYGVAAKDIILELLRRLTVKGGVGRVLEYTGDGVLNLSVPERATIANMGAELGATTSVFQSDKNTLAFLRAQGRESDYSSWEADPGALYDMTITLDLSELAPLAAKPHMPDQVDSVANIGPIRVDQVCIGSCTNSSYQDLMRAAAILKGKSLPTSVSLVVAPGSRQVLTMLARNGALADLIAAGARIAESACGYCIGMGQSPGTDGISVRTSNRNFPARSGTASAKVYLTSVETAAATALTGVLTDPRHAGVSLDIPMPDAFIINDNLIAEPAGEDEETVIVRGPNIQPFPTNGPMGATISGPALCKLGDHITTDHIMPSNAKLLPFRSNIPYLSDYCLTPVDESFPVRAKEARGGFIIAGQNYGQGSSREHAALVPVYLQIKGVIALSFARIHRDNLVNNGILPLVFTKEADYHKIKRDDRIVIPDAVRQIGNDIVTLRNDTQDILFTARLILSARQKRILLAGGLVNLAKQAAS